MLLFGAPGVGKGTQGQILHAIPGFFHLASGDIFRNLDPDCAEGREAAEFSVQGKLVPDELTIRIFNRDLQKRIEQAEYRPGEEMLVLDGIPRTLQQAENLATSIDVKLVLSFVSSDESVMVERMKLRAIRESRADDADEETIRHRFAVYRQETEPLLGSYDAEIIRQIDALLSPVEVFAEVLKSLVPVYQCLKSAAESR